MQVSAYDIVKAFGIEALGKFHNLDNQAEIAQARYEWAMVHESLHVIDAFNDGNSVFEVVFCPNTMKAHRTDYNVDVTDDYHEAIAKLCTKLDRYSDNFGLGGDYLMRFLKSLQG